MPPKATGIKYEFEQFVIAGKTYDMPKDVQPGSRRWKMWRHWQDKGLKLPAFKPAVELQPWGSLPLVPFEQYMKATA